MSAWYDAGTIARELASKADPARTLTHRIRDDATPGWTPEARAKSVAGGKITGARAKQAPKAPQGGAGSGVGATQGKQTGVSMRRAAKIDANQPAIVAALRKMGARVQSLAAVGDGCPDLLVGWRGDILVIEVKDGRLSPSARRLTPDQQRWHDAWGLDERFIVNSVDEAIELLRSYG